MDGGRGTSEGGRAAQPPSARTPCSEVRAGIQRVSVILRISEGVS